MVDIHIVVCYCKHMKKTAAQPDAWMALVLKTMSVDELNSEIVRLSTEAPSLNVDELRWLKAELLKRTRRS